ncbi:MAG: TonB-dependent receptor [Flavobacteriales bacterium]|nr:TonB-dependent receptor [Flavobacteriales bacterium]
MKTILLLSIFLLVHGLNAQQTIQGRVLESNDQGGKTKNIPIPLANIYWEGTVEGAVADAEGRFMIPEPASYPAHLIVSFVGYKSDTVTFHAYRTHIHITLQPNLELQEFEVAEKQAGTYINTIDPHHIETLTGKELAKAACCNISESFETNASVDVNFSDAVSGRKQIQMLGLDGVYTQIQFENLPLVRGLSSAYGLTYIPGTWAESIQIKKGAGSVVNGYESITGQINLELQKPDEAERLYINGYGNLMGRAELNVHAAQKLNEQWSTMSFIHASGQSIENDLNQDNFYDSPLKTQYNVFNRWKYRGEKRVFQAGIRAVYEDLSAGQIEANALEPLYYIGVKSRQVELFTKNGFLFPKQPYKSIGVINTLRYHSHDSRFGQKTYVASQYSGYLNVIYQTIIDDSDHQVKFGTSLVYDNYDKSLNKSYKFGRVEMVPGAFAELTNFFNEKNVVVLGLRGDYHNTYGFFATPRFHYKYNFTEQSAFRLSAGRGFRTANPILENNVALANSRTILLANDLKPEIAWNYGSSITHGFEVNKREVNVSLDYYFTDFVNQVVVDMEQPHEVAFYNLEGKSYSHSFQAEVGVQLTQQLEAKAAYKWYDIKTDYKSGFKTRPLTPKNRMLVNLGYTSNFDKWKFDLTGKWFGVSRLPSVSVIPSENVTASTDYFLLSGQITRAFKHFEAYVGVENATNYKQSNPIIAATDPNGPDFDASLIWGPVYGRNIYVGFRYKIK